MELDIQTTEENQGNKYRIVKDQDFPSYYNIRSYGKQPVELKGQFSSIAEAKHAISVYENRKK